MNLNDLLNEIKQKYEDVGYALEPYTDIPEVESFLWRRGQDLKEFEVLVRNYNKSILVADIVNRLKERNVNAKYYGICEKGAEYFAITQKVIDLVRARQVEEAELLVPVETERNFDQNYAIPDELSESEMEEIFGTGKEE